MGATSTLNRLAMGTRCKPVPLPFHCQWGIFGGWDISGIDAISQVQEGSTRVVFMVVVMTYLVV